MLYMCVTVTTRRQYIITYTTPLAKQILYNSTAAVSPSLYNIHRIGIYVVRLYILAPLLYIDGEISSAMIY